MSQTHLSEYDLEVLSEALCDLPSARIEHLNACAECQAIVEKLSALDPERGAREVARAVRWAPRRSDGWIGVLGIILIILCIIGIALSRVRIEALAQMVDTQEQRADAAEKALSRVCKDYLALRARAKNAGLETPPPIPRWDGRTVCDEPEN